MDLPLFNSEQIAAIHDGELARVDFCKMAAAGGHENDLSRTAAALVNGIAALRAASVPVRVVCEVMHCSPNTVQRVEASLPHLVVTLRARLGQGMLRTAALAMEEVGRRLEERPAELEANELVAAAEKFARVGSELVAAGALGGSAEEVKAGGFEAFTAALKRVQAGPVDVSSSVESTKPAENDQFPTSSPAPVVAGSRPEVIEPAAGAIDPAPGAALVAADQAGKGEEGVGAQGGGGVVDTMQTEGRNFGYNGKGETHGVD